MYVVLTGAKKNAGDFLITARALALLGKLRPERRVVTLPSWEPLDPHLSTLAEARAVIIPGGPGYQRNLHPDVYPLTTPLSRIKPPIVPLGLGWKAFPGDDVSARHYAFSPSALAALRRMAEAGPGLGCRDAQTLEILHRFGLPGVLTGCPAWYDLAHLGRAPQPAAEPSRIAFTPPELPLYREQSLAVAHTLRELYPKATLLAVFHRGIDEADAHLTRASAHNNRVIADALGKLGYELVNASRGLEKLDLYDGCDLHVGYRVHAHIFCTSHRRPSVLLHEDGRGRAQTDTLGTPGLDAYHRPLWSRALAEASVLGRRPHAVGIEAAQDLPRRLDALLRSEQARGFARTASAALFIDRQFEVMRRFVEALP
jgi:hypothetical protein